MGMIRRLFLALLAFTVMSTAQAAVASENLVWGRAILDSDWTHSSWYTVAWSPPLPRRLYHLEAYVTDQGNFADAAENCLGSVLVKSGSVTLAYLHGETWPTTGTWHYHVYLEAWVTGPLLIRMSVWAKPHFTSDYSHYMPLQDACRLLLAVKS